MVLVPILVSDMFYAFNVKQVNIKRIKLVDSLNCWWHDNHCISFYHSQFHKSSICFVAYINNYCNLIESHIWGMSVLSVFQINTTCHGFVSFVNLHTVPFMFEWYDENEIYRPKFHLCVVSLSSLTVTFII